MVASPPLPPPIVRATAAPMPRCPRCGASDVELLASQQMFAPTMDNSRDSTIVTIRTHKCRCGVGFTDTAWQSGPHITR